ncbi:hypothetical protein [Bradyrhizobium prioriisuperbiae]|uniref:hypothetical protein n=1 Tax=Bradyrhizobium prioriisuperbiae TaxID=2854389 RepID=UPI0028E67906|nr:hypothetical protein [Bradyrhizobium prioritasuperba]
MTDRRARAERLREFFSLQLRFAELLAQRMPMPLDEAVLTFTNLHRRFGLGDPDHLGVSPQWAPYVAGLEHFSDHNDRVAWTQEMFSRGPEETLPAHRRFIGCFGVDPSDANGIVRIHFLNRDSDGLSPLHRSKAERRQQELAEICALIRSEDPAAQAILGTSWLYHLEAYRRLFPPAYGASRTPAAKVRLSGQSSWGQFLTHTEAIKPTLRDAFLQTFATVDVAAPWRNFPLPALVATAPITTFFEFYLG